MSRRAFTLIELLVVIAIIGAMLAVGVVSIGAGKGAVRVKGAARDAVAAIRHARSTALVTQRPAVITYSTVKVDDEVMARIDITTEPLLNTDFDVHTVQSLTGEPLKCLEKLKEEEEETARREEKENGGDGKGHELVHIRESKAKSFNKKDSSKGAAEGETSEKRKGRTIEDILNAPIDPEVLKGMRLKVEMGETLTASGEEVRKPKISVFSNVDYLLGRNKKETTPDEPKKPEAAKPGEGGLSADEGMQEPVKVVWETNGRVDPHMVWIYPDGTKPEEGLLIKVDRFGATKVLSGDGREDDD